MERTILVQRMLVCMLDKLALFEVVLLFFDLATNGHSPVRSAERGLRSLGHWAPRALPGSTQLLLGVWAGQAPKTLSGQSRLGPQESAHHSLPPAQVETRDNNEITPLRTLRASSRKS